MNGNPITPWPQEFVEKYLEKGYWTNEPLLSVLQQSAEKYPEHVAMIHDDRTWSYQDLQQAANTYALGLAALGIKKNDVVILQLPNCGEFAEAFFALQTLGAVPVMSLPGHRFFELNAFCDIAKARAYITCDRFGGFDYENLAVQLTEKHPELTTIVVGKSELFTTWQSLKQSRFCMKPVDVDPSELALLQLSGGTTNTPKLIPRTHNDYLYSVRASAEIGNLSPNTCYLVTLPCAHNFTLSSPGILGVLSAGGTLVMANSGAPDECFSLIEKHGLSMTALVPSLALMWSKSKLIEKFDLSSLRVMQIGGAKLMPSQAQHIATKLHCKLQQVFGMAEGLVNYTRLDDGDEMILNTQGRPISPDDEIRVVDNEDRDLPVGQVGNLLTRGPYTIRGYFRAEEHNKQAFTHDGFYRTGDLVKIDADGYMTVQGRAKDQINRAGEKIAAAEVESLLINHIYVREAALVGIPDDYLGEKSIAFLTPNEESRNSTLKSSGDHANDKDNASKDKSHLSSKELRQFLKQKGLADYKIPDRFVWLNDLPVTHFGKVNKNALRDYPLALTN